MMNKEKIDDAILTLEVLIDCCKEDGTYYTARKEWEALEVFKDLQQKLDNILTYAKDRCDDYLKEDDCEYCDGVFASCRKILQLAGEDISEYK